MLHVPSLRIRRHLSFLSSLNWRDYLKVMAALMLTFRFEVVLRSRQDISGKKGVVKSPLLQWLSKF